MVRDDRDNKNNNNNLYKLQKGIVFSSKNGSVVSTDWPWSWVLFVSRIIEGNKPPGVIDNRGNI